MTSSGLGPGQSPFGGSRHRARPARPVFAPPPPPAPPAQDQPTPISQSPDAVALDACPWLYLNIEPDTRGASVTDDHRCELSPAVIPGPGHQVGYCLTPNHRGCPQLRAYEAQRRAAALGSAQQAGIIPFPAPLQPQPQARQSRPPVLRRPAASRWIWAAVGAVCAAALTAALFLAVTPGISTVDPDHEPAGQSEPVTGQLSPTIPGDTTALSPPASTTLPGSPATDSAYTPGEEIPDTYIVQYGDTLSSIARRWGLTVDALIRANDLDDGSLLVAIGDELVLPKP